MLELVRRRLKSLDLEARADLGRRDQLSIELLPADAARINGAVLSSRNQGRSGYRQRCHQPDVYGTYTCGGGITAAVICSYNGTTYSWFTH
jgi:hypothetical protein